MVVSLSWLIQVRQRELPTIGDDYWQLPCQRFLDATEALAARQYGSQAIEINY
jgi:hypothetical protein